MDKFGKEEKISKKTLNNWLKKGYIPGATPTKDGKDWDIPDKAYPPYTATRARNPDKVCENIVRACLSGRRPLADIFKCPPQQFDYYISQLAEAGLIREEFYDEISYYYPTPKSMEYVECFDIDIKDKNDKRLGEYVLTCLPAIAELVAKGIEVISKI